jgi:hypothetical protein
MPTSKKYLYLASEVHVPTGEKPQKPGDPLPIKSVGPGVLADLDLSDAEIKTIPRSLIRPASADEIEAAENSATAAETRRIAAEAAEEQRNAEILRANEKRAIEKEADRDKAEALTALDETHAEDREKEQQRLAQELNKAQGIEAPKSSSRKKE